MEILKKYNYRGGVEHILFITDYDCSKYEPDLLWFNDRIDGPRCCWDPFHREIIDYMTSTPEWEKMWKEDMKT